MLRAPTPASSDVDRAVADDAVPLGELRAVGLAAGLVAVGATGVEPFEAARAALIERKASGLHGGMQFTYRNPERSTDPSRLLAGARSLVVGAMSYAGGPVDEPHGEGAHGRVARYATEDHYAALRDGLEAVAASLRDAGHRARVVADDNGLVDRAAAVRAGLGWQGKNANVLLPGHGSWVVLGSVVTDASVAGDDEPGAAVADGCGSCRRCLDGCPTGAIVAPGVVDARRCLAWLVQAEGSFPEQHREALGGRIYGCDDCQEVCPPGRRSPEGAEPVRAAGAWVDLVGLLDGSDEELLAAHGRWYVPRRDPRYLRRNALVALGNVGDPADTGLRRRLVALAEGDDDMLAEHARWARARLAERAVAAAPDGGGDGG